MFLLLVEGMMVIDYNYEQKCKQLYLKVSDIYCLGSI
jgi:hypothetical protein